MFAYVVLILILIYGALIALVFLNQNRLIYAPPVVRDDIPAGFTRVTYDTPDRIDLTSGYLAAREGMPTLLFFHGNTSNWQSSAMVTDQLAAQGYGILAAEYRGYSGNPGTPSEEGLYQDARGAWQFLREGKGLAENDIVLVGNSIGSGVAVQLATEVRARALVLISPFDSLEETASRKLRWLPVRMLLQDRYRNDEKLPEIGEPILILHGEADSLIALEQAQSLASVRDDTVIETFPGWGHDLVVNDAVQARIAEFIASEADQM
ncbi:alpha/beta hydrolase [Aurantiacibacter sp. D1-12]|uniref:alpha/beta hydrolase n=1 Tax=Aurantiacibacter sp. D1-12 TaxID=2993658 RepID=UPI00237C7B34|nr:alpha/beta fold hydrolase [Aurantiacibacter sp. D1-12]MDE1468226.1 alpha/beta fold hydrolase [Aurantiacibacter sp. D1-12]